MKRAFTRSAIEATFRKHWDKDPNATVEIRDVVLLKDFSPPIWVLYYRHVLNGVDAYLSLIFIQRRRPDGSLYLDLPDEIKLPVGYATVDAENKSLRAQGVLKHA